MHRPQSENAGLSRLLHMPLAPEGPLLSKIHSLAERQRLWCGWQTIRSPPSWIPGFKSRRGRTHFRNPFTFHQGELGSIPGRAAPGFSHVGIVSDDAASRRDFSGISRFPPPFLSGAAPYSPLSPSSALNTSLLRAAQISSFFTHVHMLNVHSCARRSQQRKTFLLLHIAHQANPHQKDIQATIPFDYYSDLQQPCHLL
ncbi:hypothetical protein PR048_020414 [Dryococelus australis]|uniref:Uncharacterized protein n=1 Tax=Dryococelus australis TaxID=614101 RepID=A0ABQ9H695_9NEOP|nr:hypothetical protein PR048_020414 [Dryococelus australis]